MNIQDYLKKYSPAIVRVMNWDSNRWLSFDGKTNLWQIYESENSYDPGKKIFQSDSEEAAVQVLATGLDNWFKQKH